MRKRSLLLALSGILLAPLAAQADICWDMRATPRQLASSDRIRVGTLSGPWALVSQYLGRPAVCAAGWYMEYRTAVNAPNGWADPVLGVDDGGVCAAVRSPLPPPPIEEPDPADLVAAFGDLARRMDSERQRRIALTVGGPEEQSYRISRAIQIQAAIQADTATEAERTELATLLEQAAHVAELRAYGRTPTAPPMWGDTLPADQTLYGWAEATLLDADAVDALDPASPPVAAPQWPTLE